MIGSGKTGKEMISFYKKYQDKGKYSQNGEWGIIYECLKRINPILKVAIEFGAPDYYYCSNVAQLEEHYWKIKVYDINPNPDPRIIQAEITPDNVNEIIGECSVLSIDTDNNDYHIWKAYESHPDIVIIEINSSIPPGIEMIPGDKGASYTSMVELGLNKGYSLVAHSGNLIWILNKYGGLFPEIAGYNPLTQSELFFNKSFLC